MRRRLSEKTDFFHASIKFFFAISDGADATDLVFCRTTSGPPPQSNRVYSIFRRISRQYILLIDFVCGANKTFLEHEIYAAESHPGWGVDLFKGSRKFFFVGENRSGDG